MQECKKSIKVGNLQQLCSDPITDLHRSQGHVFLLGELEGGGKKSKRLMVEPCTRCRAGESQQTSSNISEADIVTFLLQEVPVRTSAGGIQCGDKDTGSSGLVAERFDLLVLWLQDFRERNFNPCFNQSFPQSSSEFISIRLETYAGGAQPHALAWG